MTKKENAFDLLRLLLAGCVLITHALLLGGYKLEDPLSVLSKNQTNLAELGVMGFFSLSGYLITGSFERTKGIFKFASHRLLRIFPGYWVCLLLSAFVLAPLIYLLGGAPAGSFTLTGSDGALSYIFKNFLLKVGQWSIRDVLNHAAYQGSLNGSLWSLFPEVQCYCFTIVAGAMGLFNRNKILLLIFTLSVLVFFAINAGFSGSHGPTVLTLSPAFKLYSSYFAGSLVCVYRDRLVFDKAGTVFLFFFTLMLLKFGGYNLLSPLLIALTLINVFQLFACRLKYDISYGVYIYSFPLQQLLFQVAGNRLPFIAFILLSASIAAAAGFFSYILVEHPFIKFRQRTDPLFK